MHCEDGKCSGLCGAGVLDDGGYRSGTQGRRLENIGGSRQKAAVVAVMAEAMRME